MSKIKRRLSMAAALCAMLPLCIAASARLLNQSSFTDDSASLRKILATQPDYTAVQTSVILNPDEGFGGKSKVAKMGNWSREESDDTIFLRESGKPVIKIYPKRKEYSEAPIEKQSEFLMSSEDIAKRDDITYKLAGTEKVGEYNCIKIQASLTTGKLKETKFFFYVSPELKNLVIKQEVILGPVSFLTLRENVSFDVSEELFRIPAGYKKVTEPVLDDPAKEILREINKPIKRRRQNHSTKRHS